MKKTVILPYLILGFISLLSASEVECKNPPIGMELAKTLEAKDLAKAKLLLKVFKKDVKVYLASCANSKDKFEETSVMILTYEDRLSDFEADMKNDISKKIDCSNVPDSKALDKAFKKDNAPEVKSLYAAYKNASENYINHCAEHEEYEIVFEESLLHDEAYDEWKKNVKK